MPKKLLNSSPIKIHSQDFTEVSIQSQEDPEEGGANTLDVSTHLVRCKDKESEWILQLSITVGAKAEEKRTSYLAHIDIRGHYQVHPSYSGDPERLVRITGASILYGAAREMICNITSRCNNGMLTLPSVSFFEKKEVKARKKTVKKTTKKTSSRASR